jgi:hypothetical protein
MRSNKQVFNTTAGSEQPLMISSKGTPPMNLDHLRRDRWHGGQLLAFSALDGPTDFFDGLTARTAFNGPGIDIKIPGECRVYFGANDPGPSPSLVASDFFEFRGSDGIVRGVFVDAHHLLIAGSCAVGRRDETITISGKGGKTLVGSTPPRNWMQATSMPSWPGSVRSWRGSPVCSAAMTRQVYGRQNTQTCASASIVDSGQRILTY